MSHVPGIRDSYFIERLSSTTTAVVETNDKPVAVESMNFPLEARGEDPEIDMVATANMLYHDDEPHRRLSEAFKDAARRLSEPDSFDSLFT